jgi:hypothetical protein
MHTLGRRNDRLLWPTSHVQRSAGERAAGKVLLCIYKHTCSTVYDFHTHICRSSDINSKIAAEGAHVSMHKNQNTTYLLHVCNKA